MTLAPCPLTQNGHGACANALMTMVPREDVIMSHREQEDISF